MNWICDREAKPSMNDPLSSERIARCYDIVRKTLLSQRNRFGHWTGELSTSALATATAVLALEIVRRDQTAPKNTHPHTRGSLYVPPLTKGGLGGGAKGGSGDVHHSSAKTKTSFSDDSSTASKVTTEAELSLRIQRGLAWLVDHQNDDGGWGDTPKSLSNISTTMLAHAVFHATGQNETYRAVVKAASAYLDRAGGVQALLARYGKDKTFSIPILTHCALAGVVDWSDVKPLPFELACLPPRFYKSVQLSVVSYALPALIAIGQVRHHYRKPRNPILRLVRNLAIRPSLQTLERIQPVNGGFLEAAPLTSFVTMSLAGMGMSNHPVAKRGVRFLLDSVRDDGSWPIDTNLATWVTTLSVNALQNDLPQADRSAIREWLLAQQFRERHASTNAAPGGWAWTDLPGGVPDVDDTSGAILALLNLRPLCPPPYEGRARGGAKERFGAQFGAKKLQGCSQNGPFRASNPARNGHSAGIHHF